jgi:hypothetical protein
MGVNIIDLSPPHLNPPPPRGEEVFFDSIGVIYKTLCDVNERWSLPTPSFSIRGVQKAIDTEGWVPKILECSHFIWYGKPSLSSITYLSEGRGLLAEIDKRSPL